MVLFDIGITFQASIAMVICIFVNSYTRHEIRPLIYPIQIFLSKCNPKTMKRNDSPNFSGVLSSNKLEHFHYHFNEKSERVKISIDNLNLIREGEDTNLTSFFPFLSFWFWSLLGQNPQLDDLYTRYRQRLRKSLFVSGLWISFAACIVSIIFCAIGTQVRITRIHSN